MWELGVYIILGLPNSTSVNQEMDQLYQTFKGQCRAKTLTLFSNKLTSRSNKIIKCQSILRGLNYLPPKESIQDIQLEAKDVSSALSTIKQALKDLCIITKPLTSGNDDIS